MKKTTVPDVLPLVDRYYAMPGNSVGGTLHAVLEDGNVDDQSILICRGWAEKKGDTDAVEIADMMLAMTKTQRKRVSFNSGF